jgi:hypothetical protein
MRLTLVVHILAGALALGSGYIALYAAKGASLHRKSGMLFVVAMLVMAMTGSVIALVHGAAPALNVPAALLTAYLVVTSLATVRPPAIGSRWLHLGAMLVALAVGIACLRLGIQVLAAGGRRASLLTFPLLLFATIGLLGSASDLRIVRSGLPRGTARLTRHLWRMSMALLITAMAFFFGQADVLPAALRIPAVLAAPVLAVVVTMLYWVWRVGVRKALRGVQTAGPI